MHRQPSTPPPLLYPSHHSPLGIRVSTQSEYPLRQPPPPPPPPPPTSLTPWNKSLHTVRVPTETGHVHRHHPLYPSHHSPLGIRVSTQSEYPLRQAMCTGSIPPAPLRIRLAPLQARVLVTEAWPCRAAMCRAVFFCLSSTSTRAPVRGGREGANEIQKGRSMFPLSRTLSFNTQKQRRRCCWMERLQGKGCV